ncbi:glutamate receptor ionotropic, delta-2-like isoform X2 [Macrobrachium nipponense]|uniref:glutamate receptor ionotropic, delta-2-like isoform X2 n=1 Tax=Macrobrachium nipponense TaxID=159736 RepID=UPI0030C873E8
MASRFSIIYTTTLGCLLLITNCDPERLPLPANAEDGLADNKVTALISASKKQEIQMQFLSAKASEELFAFIFSVSPPHIFYFLYDETYKDMSSVLTTPSNNWISYAVTQFSQDFTPLLGALSSSLVAASSSRRHVLVACNEENTLALFRLISRRNLESPSIWWIVMVTSENTMQLLQLALREGSQVIAIQITGMDSVKLHASRMDSAGLVRFQDSGVWTLGHKDFTSKMSRSLFYDLDARYSNFERRKLTGTANSVTPFIVLEKQDDGQLILTTGFEGSVIKALSKTLNFTYRMMTPADGQWGGPLPNGSVTGLIGDVYRRQAHFAMTSITITQARERIIDFTYPYHTDSLTLVSRTPKREISASAVFSPFSAEVWYLIASTPFAFSLVVFFQVWITKTYLRIKTSKYSFSNIFINACASLLRQENQLLFEHWSGQTAFLLWYLYAFMVSALYSGMLITTIVIPSYNRPIDSLTDLPKAISNGFTLQVAAETSHEFLFKDATSGIYAETWKLFNHKDRSKSFVDTSLSYDEILEKKIVIVEAETAGKFRSMKRGRRHYYFARDTFSPQNYGIACFPGAPFIGKFNKVLSSLIESGLIKKWMNEEFRKVEAQGTTLDEEAVAPRPFSLTQMQWFVFVTSKGNIPSPWKKETCE